MHINHSSNNAYFFYLIRGTYVESLTVFHKMTHRSFGGFYPTKRINLRTK